MAEAILERVSGTRRRLLLGFVAAFLSTLVFHQLGLEVCHLVGLTPNTPYNFTRTVPPFGVPQVLSLAFWGGVWGIVFVLVEPWIVRLLGSYWVGAVLFGAIIPTVFSWLVVAPLKGQPLGYGFVFPMLVVGPIINGLWGLGTGVFLGFLPGAGTRPTG
jgi:hypothetical protein